MYFLGIQLQDYMQRDFDAELGSVNYTITERKNSRFVSVPISTGVLLVKLNKSADPLPVIDKILETLNGNKLDYE